MRNDTEKEALITDNMKLVYYLVSRYYPRYIQNEDVIQEGMLGLVQAAAEWDETRSKFSTYASTCILNQIRYYFRREKNQVDTVSLDEVCYVDEEENKMTIMDTLVGEEDVDLAESYFADFYQKLDDRDKMILELSWQGYTQLEIAQQVNLSRQNVGWRLNKLKQQWRESYERC